MSACHTYAIDLSAEAAAAVRQQDLRGLPYHPLALHLDLSILAYQLYTQSLAWPFDPYFEEFARAGDAPRDAFMGRVRRWAAEVGAAQVEAGAGIEGFRGPGVLAGFDDNPRHDPIVYQYSRIHPWGHAISKPDQRWVEYLTPKMLTEQIAEVQICYRATGAAPGVIRVESLDATDAPRAPGARDVLWVVEGGTGDKGEAGQPASQSLMALALLRAHGAEGHDLHIAFRGSRSGKGSRAAQEAFSTEAASGNPDWITDLGYFEVSAPEISPLGEVSRGMSTSLSSILPALLSCLAEGAGARGVVPERIYVTGHSLGGGLAQHFASAMLLGEVWSPAGERMPPSIRDWPWANLKLITFSAPRVGNLEWARALTEGALGARLYLHSPFSPWDQGAIGVTDPDLLPRLTDPAAPAGYRVLIHTDPITSGVIQGGEHVGQTVYLDVPGIGDEFKLSDLSTHEPLTVRDRLLSILDDDRIPPTAWANHPIEDRVPDRVAGDAGARAEFEKLHEATRRYYDEVVPGYDVASLDASFATFLELLDGE